MCCPSWGLTGIGPSVSLPTFAVTLRVMAILLVIDACIPFLACGKTQPKCCAVTWPSAPCLRNWANSGIYLLGGSLKPLLRVSTGDYASSGMVGVSPVIPWAYPLTFRSSLFSFRRMTPWFHLKPTSVVLAKLSRPSPRGLGTLACPTLHLREGTLCVLRTD